MTDTRGTAELLKSDVRDPQAAKKYLENGNKALENGDRQAAIKAYQAAYTVDPDNAETCFRLAYLLDLAGDDDQALRLYEHACHASQPPLNALINLAVMYEDRNEYGKAERCLRQVLSTDPNHPRARMYMKDVKASADMVIDDEAEEHLEKHHALLDTPVADFDLSVRARNALRKINVRTLGDLLKVTEAELRSFKNFGEASLEEIKAMLAQRGLRLGQAVDEQHQAAKEAVYEQLGEAGEGDNEMLQRPVTDLDFSVRSRKALSLLGIQTVGDLVVRTEAELMGVKNFGVTSLNEIKEKLTELGLSLRTLE